MSYPRPHPAPQEQKPGRLQGTSPSIYRPLPFVYCIPLLCDLHLLFPDSTFNLICNPHPVTHTLPPLLQTLPYILLCQQKPFKLLPPLSVVVSLLVSLAHTNANGRKGPGNDCSRKEHRCLLFVNSMQVQLIIFMYATHCI